MPLPDSAPEKWVYKEHTRVKHEILRKYMDGWVRILGSTYRTICYIDGFAGRGIYEDGSPGSPIIIMELAENMKKNCDKIICYNIENDKQNFKRLEVEVAKAKLKFPQATVINQFGNFQEAISYILNENDDRLPPTFIFIDPFGFSGVPFHLIKRLLAIPRTEILFTFMTRDINRFLESEKHRTALCQLFGFSNVPEMLATEYPNTKADQALLALYRDNLHINANVKYTMPYRVLMTEKRDTLYYLLHASNHFKAFYLMKSIMYHESKTGMFCYLGPDESSIGGKQMRLYQFDDSDFKKYLLEKFRGHSISFNDILESSYDEVPFIEKDYRAALKALEKTGIISVKRISSKTQRGLSNEDMVTFPPESKWFFN